MMNAIDSRIRQLEAAIDQALSYDQDTAGLEAELTALQKGRQICLPYLNAGLEYELTALQKRASVDRRNSRKERVGLRW